MFQTYRNIMDSEQNPLRNLAPAQRLQVMVFLSVMWSTVFCLSTASWLWYRELIIGHVLVALGIMITAITFQHASNKNAISVASYRDHPENDGTSRYDDVWGG